MSRVDELTLSMMDGTISDDEQRELFALTDADPAALRAHNSLLGLEFGLRGMRRDLDLSVKVLDQMVQAREARVAAAVMTDVRARRIQETARRARRDSWIRRLAVAACFLLVAVGAAFAWRAHRRRPSGQAAIGQLVDQRGARVPRLPPVIPARDGDPTNGAVVHAGGPGAPGQGAAAGTDEGSSAACTLFVSPTGQDDRSGTEAEPKRTIQKAVNAARPGDVICVREGVYDVVNISTSGTESAPITLRNYPGERPVIEAPGKTGIEVCHHPWREGVPVGWVNIEGFEVRANDRGIDLTTVHHVSVRHNLIRESKIAGIGGAGHDIIVDGNELLGAGIGMAGVRITIVNNIIVRFRYGVAISSGPCYDECPDQRFSRASDWLIAHNVIAFPTRTGIMLSFGAENFQRVVVENNIFYEASAEYSVALIKSPIADGGLTIRHNISYSRRTKKLMNPNPTVVLESNIEDRDPLFVNPKGGDFRLLAGSPAIDAGRSLPEVKTDFAGTPRPRGRGYDIGAFER